MKLDTYTIYLALKSLPTPEKTTSNYSILRVISVDRSSQEELEIIIFSSWFTSYKPQLILKPFMAAM